MKKNNSEMKNPTSHSYTRREFCGSCGLSLGLFLSMPFLSEANVARSADLLLGFKAISASKKDQFIVPPGYIAKPFISWGDPLFKQAPAFEPSGFQDAAVQAMQFGDNNDGMSLFPISDTRAILVVNNEYANHRFLFSHFGLFLEQEDVDKSQAAHGVSIVEIQKKADGSWQYLQNSKYNRRITATTPIDITGPVAGHPLLKTEADPSGKRVLGTINNCANGETPWGTYLTCEENFNYYFASKKRFKPNKRQQRYNLNSRDKRNFQWYKYDQRFDLNQHPNEANRFGWVVEIDPFDPTSTPKKRTALGRFQHENAALTISESGHVIVYMGDDQAGEHLYKFVSKRRYQADNPRANRELLDEGTLFAASFDNNDYKQSGSGKWLELTYGKNGLTKENGFNSQEDVLLFTRLAATVVGATTMDRPEWVAIHPDQRTVYATLTKNKLRGLAKNQPINGPNPRKANQYGQIVRWWPKKGNHDNPEFDWDLFVLAGNPQVYEEGLNRGSDNINQTNMFCGPDGIRFDKSGRLWILTDGNYTNFGNFSGMGNNQMLCADPSSGEIRRFATGPIGCEITGIVFTPDQRTVFVGVQHPGGKIFSSHFPAGGDSKPRSTIMMIQRSDGGVIGT